MGEGQPGAARRLTASVRLQVRAVRKRWTVASPFDRARVLIAAGYAVVFLGLFGFVLGTGEAPSSLRASAWYQALDDEFHVRVENRSTDRWEGVRLTLNGRYEFGIGEMLPTQSHTVRLDRFRIPGCVEAKTKKKRRRHRRRKRRTAARSTCAPPRGEAPRELVVQWSEGAARWPFPPSLAGARPAGEKP